MDGSPLFDASNQTKESISINEIDKRVMVAADFLKGQDILTRSATINDRGGIVGVDEAQASIGGDLHFSTNREVLINKFRIANETCVRDYKQDPAVVDAKVVNGCVVVTYDSSRSLPIGFSLDQNRGDYAGPTSYWTHDASGNAIQLNRLGLITIDLNQAKRDDGVDATTSLQHELSHHNVMMTDYLMAIDPQLYMKSSSRIGRKTALFGDSKDRVTTTQAFSADLPFYELILNRNRREIMENDIDAQLGYLDELHSSALQRKPEWFNVEETVYNNRGKKGKHWEVVGDNLNDREITKKLLRYFQAAYLSEMIVQTFAKQPTIGEGQRLLLEQVPEMMRTMCALVGTSRSISQAAKLVEKPWNDFANSDLGIKLIKSQAFTQWREQVYQTGWADQNLKQLFELSKNN